MKNARSENTFDKIKKNVDNYLFIKNGYSIVKHFVPFAIAALMLILLLSFQEDKDILFQLFSLFKTPNVELIPAILLASVTTVIYYYTIKSQILQAYLWPEGDYRRTVFTVIIYILMCTILAILVLYIAADPPSSVYSAIPYLFVSYLVAALSLTGVGWEGPSSWVDAMGIKSPDYSGARQAVKKITEILIYIRDKSAPKKDPDKNLSDFKKAIEQLVDSINANIELEPKWARPPLECVLNLLFELIQIMDDKFGKDDIISNGDKFEAACKGGIYGNYKDFYITLEKMSLYWPNWKCRD